MPDIGFVEQSTVCRWEDEFWRVGSRLERSLTLVEVGSSEGARSPLIVPRQLTFCANCESERLDLVGTGPDGIGVRCYVCTKQLTVRGIILGEIDFLAGAKTKVDAMIARAREAAVAKVRKGVTR